MLGSEANAFPLGSCRAAHDGLYQACQISGYGAESLAILLCRAVSKALTTCKELQQDSPDNLEEACDSYIRDHLLPAINRQGKNGW